jgi:uncharacterized membrane protein
MQENESKDQKTMMSWCGWWCCRGCPSSSFVQLLVRLVVLLRLLFLLVWLLGRRNDELVRLVVLLPLLFLLSGVAAALAYGCSQWSSPSRVEESLLLAWQRIGALGVSVFCSFFTVLWPPLLLLHLLRNELLLAAKRKGE